MAMQTSTTTKEKESKGHAKVGEWCCVTARLRCCRRCVVVDVVLLWTLLFVVNVINDAETDSSCRRRRLEVWFEVGRQDNEDANRDQSVCQ